MYYTVIPEDHTIVGQVESYEIAAFLSQADEDAVDETFQVIIDKCTNYLLNITNTQPNRVISPVRVQQMPNGDLQITIRFIPEDKELPNSTYYMFKSLDDVISFCQKVDATDIDSTLYKRANEYCLHMASDNEKKYISAFLKLSEFGKQINYDDKSIPEHSKVIIQSNAIQTLQSL